MRASAFACILALAACSGPGTPTNQSQEDLAALQDAAYAEMESAISEPVAPEPPPPSAPGNMLRPTDDRVPVPEASSLETSAQGAANVLRTYFALLEQARYREARNLWSDSGRSTGTSADAFAGTFDEYQEYHATIGAPGRIEGAAGSLYVDMPVQLYGRLANGEPFRMRGSATLRRANEVPGSTVEQRKWRIASIEVSPR